MHGHATCILVAGAAHVSQWAGMSKNNDAV